MGCQQVWYGETNTTQPSNRVSVDKSDGSLLRFVCTDSCGHLDIMYSPPQPLPCGWRTWCVRPGRGLWWSAQAGTASASWSVTACAGSLCPDHQRWPPMCAHRNNELTSYKDGRLWSMVVKTTYPVYHSWNKRSSKQITIWFGIITVASRCYLANWQLNEISHQITPLD